MIDFRYNYPILRSQHQLLMQALSELEQDESYMKMAVPGGHPEDKKVAADWLSKPGFPIAADAVVIGCGGHHALSMIILATELSGGKVLVDPVTYNGFIGLSSMFNITLIPCPVDEDGLRPDVIAALCKADNIKAVYLMPTIHNPLCYIMPLQRRQEVVEVARQFDLLLIDDDAYGFLDSGALPSFAHLAPERGFYIYSFSKILAPGIKTSYIVTPEKWKSQTENAAWMTSSGSVTLYNRLVSNWVKQGIVEKVIEEKRQAAAEKQRLAANILKKYNYLTQVSSYHFWIPLPQSANARQFGESLSEKGVDVVTSAAYNVTGDISYNGIRVALGNVPDEKVLTEGLMIIEESLAGLF